MDMKDVVENYKDIEMGLFCIVGNLMEQKNNIFGYCTGIIRKSDGITAIVQIVRGKVEKFDFTYDELEDMAKKLNIKF